MPELKRAMSQAGVKAESVRIYYFDEWAWAASRRVVDP